MCDSVCFLFGFVILDFFVFGGGDKRSFQLKVCFHLLRRMQERFFGVWAMFYTSEVMCCVFGV